MYVSYVIANDKFGVSNMLRTGEVIAVVLIMMIDKQSVNVIKHYLCGNGISNS